MYRTHRNFRRRNRGNLHLPKAFPAPAHRAPGPTLPALPALCLALAFDIGATANVSNPVLGLKLNCFEKPQSIT